MVLSGNPPFLMVWVGFQPGSSPGGCIMKGFQIVAYVDAKLEPKFDRPTRIKRTIKSWRATREEAEAEATRLGEEYGAIVEIHD